jgi:hypothetical protein
LQNVHPWDIAQAHYDSFKTLLNKEWGELNTIYSTAYTDPRSPVVQGVPPRFVVDADAYMNFALKLRTMTLPPPETFFDSIALQELATQYYQQYGAL